MITNKLRAAKRRVVHELHRALHETPPGDRVVVLLTIPRSGSTWSMDLLRTHPQIEMHPRYYVHNALGLHGRRYPRDLSNGPDATLNIEVTQHQWERIPVIPSSPQNTNRSEQIDLEKIHPHFFRHEVDEFVQRVHDFSQKRPLKMIYQVRDPREILVSHLEYKSRNPSWERRTPSRLVPHIRRMFESLHAVHGYLPGLVVDYSELKRFPGKVLSDLFLEITGVAPNDSGIEKALHATRREKKTNTEGSFIGKRHSSDLTDRYGSYFSEHKKEISLMDSIYNKIIL